MKESAGANSNEQRLPRLLALVPYLQARPGAAVADVAEDFGISEAQLRKDLQLLWLCGLPGHSPGDLIDLSFEGDTISVIFDAGMARPLRLTAEEALALIVALRTLSGAPGLADTDAVQRALAKVEQAAGGAVDGSTVAVELEHAERIVPLLQRGLDGQRALRIRHYSASRDELTERTVDPLRLVEAEGQTYLEAWCRQAEGMRVFRVDRIEDVTVLAEPAAVPDNVRPRDLSEGVFQPAADHLMVDLRISGAYAWVADYYPTEDVHEEGDLLRARLRVSDPGWVRALVLGSAGQVEVLSPDWLADGVRAQAQAALDQYATT